MLPGHSARHWARLSALGYFAAIPVILLMIGFSTIADERLRALLLLADLGLFASLGIAASIAYARMGRRSREEIAAGYTTLHARLYAYWEIDDRTGEVLRHPGERDPVKRSTHEPDA